MSTVYYDKLNISKLRVGDIVRLLPDTSNYGSFQDMIVSNIHTVEYPTIHSITWVEFTRPYGYMNHVDGKLFTGVEKFEAAQDHGGLFYKVKRNVDLYQNQVINYHGGQWLLVGFDPVDSNTGMVSMKAIYNGDIKQSENSEIIHVQEMELNWKSLTSADWSSPDLLFFDPNDNKIKQYRDYQPYYKSKEKVK